MFDVLLPRSFFRDSLFDDVLGPVRQSEVPARGTQWRPAIEGHVKNNSLVVRADLPGVDPQHVDVSLEGTQLKISGERKVDEQGEKDGTRYSEVRYGRFERTLAVPEGLDPEKVTAKYANGVLEVTLALPTAQLPRKVPVQFEHTKKAA